jgi:hypothetical protein
MLISNWMGSPEYRVLSSPEQEVSQELLPQEGHSALLAVPYEALVNGEYLPGQEVEGNPHLTLALEEFEAALGRESCRLNDTEHMNWPECASVVLENGTTKYVQNNLLVQWGIRKPESEKSAMPDPVAVLIIGDEQPNLKRLTLHFEVPDPENPDEMLVDYDRVGYRHADSSYEGQ